MIRRRRQNTGFLLVGVHERRPDIKVYLSLSNVGGDSLAFNISKR